MSEEPLSKDLGFGLSARLDEDGTLTLIETRTGFNALEELVTTFTELPMPAQAARALHNFLNEDVVQKRTGHRRRDGSKHKKS